MSNIFKMLLGAIATILLGAIGSGLWEKILSPFFGYLSQKTTSVLSYFSQSYSNSIYERAANLYAPNASDSTAIILLSLVSIALFLYALSTKKENYFIGVLHSSMVKPFQGWLGIIYSGALFVAMLIMVSRQTAIEHIQRYSFQQMEIIRPYVEDKQYFQIRSYYFRVTSEEDFEKFLCELNSTARQVSVDILEFKEY